MFFPIYINLENKEILVVGGGKLANRKTETLVEYNANITVMSKEIVDEELKKRSDVKFVYNNLENNDEIIENLIKNYYMVIAATNDLELNDKIAKIAMKNNILINNVSSKTEMNAMFGAIVKNDEFHVAISTLGKNCKRSRALKDRVKKLLDEIENIGK